MARGNDPSVLHVAVIRQDLTVGHTVDSSAFAFYYPNRFRTSVLFQELAGGRWK